MVNVYGNLFVDFEGKVLLGIPRHKWEDNIKMYRGSSVVKVLCYKSEGRWFDPSWCHWNFSLI